jgi:lysine-N-methylase
MQIEISEEEQRRILSQGWTSADGVDPQAMIVVEAGKTRLCHREDGACVFLSTEGRCRIHEKFGKDAKPLACRLYPLAIHPAGQKLVVSLRFSCPSAVENRGRALSEQLPEIRELAKQLVPANFQPGPPPAVLHETSLGWEDFRRYVTWLDRTLSATDAPVALRVVRALHWLKAVAKASFDRLSGNGADEILQALVQSAVVKLPALPEDLPPTRFGRLFLRTLVLDYARTATAEDARLTSNFRWKGFWILLRWLCPVGRVPPIGLGAKGVRFSDIERPFGPLPGGAEAELTRFLRVKVNGLHFCGPAYYGFGLIDGFSSLALTLPAILWLSRWSAAGAGRLSLTDADVAQAIRTVDYHHGYSQKLSTAAARRRLHMLAQRDDIARLCCHYAR